jgi:hypothetical protein
MKKMDKNEKGKGRERRREWSQEQVKALLGVCVRLLIF